MNLKKSVLFSLLASIAFAPSHAQKATATFKVLQSIHTPMEFMVYERDYLQLEVDFIAKDTAGFPISKLAFFEKLVSGNYWPLFVDYDENGMRILQLEPFPYPYDNTNDVRGTIVRIAELCLKDEQMIGKTIVLPATMIEYVEAQRSKNSEIQYLVIKAWFLACKPCVEEIPDINQEIVKLRNRRKKVLFMAPVFDDSVPVKKFLDANTMYYEVFPNHEGYLRQTLGIERYPTHILVNSQLQVIRVSSKYEHIFRHLESLLKASSANQLPK